MCKKRDFPVVFNVCLGLFISLVLTIFNLAVNQNLTLETFLTNLIPGFCLNMTLETVIDLAGFGNYFVRLFHLDMDSLPAYFVRILFIVLILAPLMSFFLMFCDIGFSAGPAFFLIWLQALPPIFVVAYITALVGFVPCMKLTQALCVREG